MVIKTEVVNVDVTLAGGGELPAGRSFVVFQLTENDVDVADNQVIPSQPVEFELDEDGIAVANVWPNDRGERGTFYRVSVVVKDERGVSTRDEVYKYGFAQFEENGGPYNLAAEVFDGIAPGASGTIILKARVRFPDGTVGLPAMSFAEQPNTGVYRPSASVIGLSVNGTERARFTTSGMQLNGAMSGTAVTQTPVDDTAGRLIKVGDSASLLADYYRKNVSDLLADTDFTYTAGQPGTVAVGDIIRTRAEGFSYQVAASNATGPDIIATEGGVRLIPESLADGSLAPEAFGFKSGIAYADSSGITENTVALQKCINTASFRGVFKISFGEGHYLYNQLYFFYDETLNPEFNNTINRHGKFCLDGAGRLAVADIRGYSDTSNKYGTVLEATGDGIVVASAALGHNDFPFPARAFEANDITFVANKAGQYVVRAEGCPFFQTRNCALHQRHVNGHGAAIKSAWFWDLEHTRIFGVPNSTGTLLALGTTIFAGIGTLRNCLVDTGGVLVDWQEGVFVNVKIENTAFQNGAEDQILVSGGALQQLWLDNVYFEGPGLTRRYDVRSVGGALRQLRIDNMFYLNADADGTSRVSQRNIELGDVDSVQIDGVYGFRSVTPFMRVNSFRNSGRSAASVKNFTLSNDFSLTGVDPFYLFEGVLPEFGANVIWPGYENGYRGSNVIRLFDPDTAYPRQMVDRRTGVVTIGPLSLGPVKFLTGVTTTVNVTATEISSAFDITVTAGAGVSCTLPNQVFMPDGRLFLVNNNPASAGVINLRNSSDFTSLGLVRPGQSALVIYDGVARKYMLYHRSIAQQPAIANLTDPPDIDDFNGLLAALRGAGVIAT